MCKAPLPIHNALMARVFIDGQHGTAGMCLAHLLRQHPCVELLELPSEKRKDVGARRARMNGADLVVLCLPMTATAAALDLVPDRTPVVDVSNAHRCVPGWVYGLPELGERQRTAIAAAQRVSNPGCFATAFILALRPLVATGIVAATDVVHCFALTGYSAGGRRMIDRHEKGEHGGRLVALDLDHRHLPEMRAYAGLDHTPVFMPAVGTHRAGMHLSVPIDSELDRADLLSVYHERYDSEPFVRVIDDRPKHLSPEHSTPTNCAELLVTGALGRHLVSVRLHNLIKGAAGTAVQNINLMLGVAETMGLL